MIYYFSGTGNSYAAAKFLADGLGEGLMDIAVAVKEGKYEYTLAENEKLGFVFPVYAWAPPSMVTDFIRNLELYYSGDPYIFAVCTCGATAGRTMSLLEHALEENGLVLDSGFSIVMPDNCIPLFEPDSDEKVAETLKKAEKTMDNILRAIRLGWSDFFRVKKGRMGSLLTTAVNPAFVKGMKTKSFYVTENCISCGLCEKICTSSCIEMTAGRPVWTEDSCNMCLACLNRCPAKAIQYGRKTEKRSRYVHPIYQTNKNGEMTE